MMALRLRLLLVVSMIASIGTFATAANARTYTYDGLHDKLTYKSRTWAGGGTAGSPRAKLLKWTWGDRKAVGRGILIVRSCNDTCVDATFTEYTGKVTFTSPATCRTRAGRAYRYFRTVKFSVDEPDRTRTTTLRYPRSQLNAYGCHR